VPRASPCKDGKKLVKVGSSGTMPGEKERVELADPVKGGYVLRVINYASGGPTYTLKATLLKATLVDSEVVPGKVERWTLNCEKKGKVLQTVKVRVDRGQRAGVDLGACARKW
jgi:hypothetical protein